MKTQAKQATTLKRLEVRLQLPSVRTSRQQLDQLLADEFQEFASTGATYNKRQIISLLVDDPESAQPRYAMVQNLKINWLAEGVVLLTYRSSKTTLRSARAVRANRSSIWKKIDGRWQLVFHQGTPLGRSPS